jgi:hypothetical protein
MKKGFSMILGVLATAAVTVLILWVIRWFGPARRLAGLSGPPMKNPVTEATGATPAA